MYKQISSGHLLNVLDVFFWGLSDTIRELDHVERREDITAENFMAVLSSKVLRLDSDAKRLGVDVKFVYELVAALHDTVSSTQDRLPRRGPTCGLCGPVPRIIRGKIRARHASKPLYTTTRRRLS